jgi:hypothetical protein
MHLSALKSPQLLPLSQIASPNPGAGDGTADFRVFCRSENLHQFVSLFPWQKRMGRGGLLGAQAHLAYGLRSTYLGMA